MGNEVSKTSSMPADGLTGAETLLPYISDLQEATVLDFWRWAFGDLRANDVRGVFAEWLVAKLLNIPLAIRESWADWDLETSDGVRIEVKTGAYLQSWEQKCPSKIVFQGLKSRTWSPETGYSDACSHNADIYVFCVQIERDPAKWDALDLDQWRFYLLSREELGRLDCKSISLSRLARLSDELTANDLRKAYERRIDLIA